MKRKILIIDNELTVKNILSDVMSMDTNSEEKNPPINHGSDGICMFIGEVDVFERDQVHLLKKVKKNGAYEPYMAMPLFVQVSSDGWSMDFDRGDTGKENGAWTPKPFSIRDLIVSFKKNLYLNNLI